MKKIRKMTVVAMGIPFLIVLIMASISYSQSQYPKIEGQYPGINAAWTKAGEFKYKGTIKIGDLSDITGKAAKTVQACSAGIQDWLRYQNEYLGGVAGYKIEATTVDTKYDPQNMVNTVNRFADEGKALIYSVIMYTIPSTVEIANRRGIVVLSASSPVSQSILDPEREKTAKNFFFQMSPVVASRMDILVKFAIDDWKKKSKTGKPKFGTFNEDAQNGHEAATATRIFVNKAGGEFTVHTYHASTITDAVAQVAALKKAKVDYITNGPDHDQPLAVFGLELLRQKDASWNPIYLGHTDWGTVYMETGHKAYENHYVYQYSLGWTDVNEPIIKFSHDLTKMWYPNIKQRPPVYYIGYQGGLAICEAFKIAAAKYGDPTKVTGDQIRQILDTYRNFDPLGVSGPISYRPYDHQGVSSLRIAQCKDRKLVPASGFIQARELEPNERYGKFWLTD